MLKPNHSHLVPIEVKIFSTYLKKDIHVVIKLATVLLYSLLKSSLDINTLARNHVLPAISDSISSNLVKDICFTIFLHFILDPASLTHWIVFFVLTVLRLTKCSLRWTYM